MQFEFSTPTRIIFGSGKLDSIGSLVTNFGERVLVISGAPAAISSRLIGLLEQVEITYSSVQVGNEPTVDDIRSILDIARQTPIDVIIGIGGGSALDVSKAISALLTNPGDISDYLEVIGTNKPLINPSVPLITIPTTAGTGAEVTRNAVIGSPAHHVKVSLRSPHLLPRIALVDPVLTLTLLPLITATTGLDALTQLIEPFTCISPNPLTDALCVEAIQRVANSLYKAFDHGDNLAAREDMSLAAMFSGLALANARLGAVHGLAGPIGGEIPAPHGSICAALLPHVMSANISALQARSPEHPALEHYSVISRLLSDDPSASVEAGIQWVKGFCAHAGVHPLSSYGMTEALFPKIIDKAYKSSSMKGNALTLSVSELRTILQMSL